MSKVIRITARASPSRSATSRQSSRRSRRKRSNEHRRTKKRIEHAEGGSDIDPPFLFLACYRYSLISVAQGFSPAYVIVRKHRFRKQEGRRGKTRRRHLLLTVMALGPSLALAEEAGSRVLSSNALTPTSIVCST